MESPELLVFCNFSSSASNLRGRENMGNKGQKYVLKTTFELHTHPPSVHKNNKHVCHSAVLNLKHSKTCSTFLHTLTQHTHTHVAAATNLLTSFSRVCVRVRAEPSCPSSEHTWACFTWRSWERRSRAHAPACTSSRAPCNSLCTHCSSPRTSSYWRREKGRQRIDNSIIPGNNHLKKTRKNSIYFLTYK